MTEEQMRLYKLHTQERIDTLEEELGRMTSRARSAEDRVRQLTAEVATLTAQLDNAEHPKRDTAWERGVGW